MKQAGSGAALRSELLGRDGRTGAEEAERKRVAGGAAIRSEQWADTLGVSRAF